MSRKAKTDAAEAIAKLARKPKAAKGVGKRDRLLKKVKAECSTLELGKEGGHVTKVSLVIKAVPTRLREWNTAERSVFVAMGPGTAHTIKVNGAQKLAYLPFERIFAITALHITSDSKHHCDLQPDDYVTIETVEATKILYQGATFTQ